VFPLGILCLQVITCVYTEYLMFLLHILRVESASCLMAVIATKHNVYSQNVSVK